MHKRKRRGRPIDPFDDDCPLCQELRRSGEPIMTFDADGLCRVDFASDVDDRITVLLGGGPEKPIEVGLPAATTVGEALALLGKVLGVADLPPVVEGDSMPLDGRLEEGTLIELVGPILADSRRRSRPLRS